MSSGIKFDTLPIVVPNGKTIQECLKSGWGERNVANNPRASKFHKGADLSYPGCRGGPIVSVSPGKIVYVSIDKEYVQNNGNPRNLPVSDICGNGVTVEHTEIDGKTKYRTVYCHMLDSPLVTAGQQVAAGTQLGTIGDTGNPTKGAHHLHITLLSSRFAGYPAIPIEPYLFSVGQVLPVKAPPPLPPVASRPTVGPLRAGLSSKITGLQSFHPFIQYELTRRRFASETANTYMPFVKLTSLVHVLGKNTEIGKNDEKKGYCPTLGIHGQDDVLFETIFTPQSKRSIVAWATDKENPKNSIRVVVENSDEDPPNIPPPGILSMTTERNTAGAMGVRGGLFRANVKIAAYSVGQMNALLRYFLRPATRVVLELGRKSSSPQEQEITSFNWNRSLTEINEEIEAIVRTTDSQGIKQEALIRKYVYDNFGNYEIFVGYVANFKFKYTKSNTYDIDLEIHSAQQFELPVKLSGARSLCGPQTSGTPTNCGVLDIEDYFSTTSGFKGNSFNALISKALSEQDPHVIKLENVAKEGNTGDGGYLVSWQFFINRILNDEKYGLLGVLQLNDELSTKVMIRNAFPQPITTKLLQEDSAGNLDLNQYEVGWHKYLRSTDAGTMLIDNEKAQEYRQDKDIPDILKAAGIDATGLTALKNQKIEDAILAGRSIIGSFTESSIRGKVGTLAKGIWINTNAIVESFANADTVSSGLNNLLTKMNNATQGYWNLQVLSNDQNNPGIHIIDMGLSKPNTQPIQPLEDEQKITGLQNNRQAEVNLFSNPGTSVSKYLYKFNKKTKRATSTNTLSGITTVTEELERTSSQTSDRDNSIGSEILDITYEAGLPTVIAVQAIAGVGGVGQRGTLAAINVKELKELTLYDIYPDCSDSPNNVCAGESAPAATTAPGYKSLTTTEIQEFTKRYTDANATTEARVKVLSDLNTKIATQDMATTSAITLTEASLAATRQRVEQRLQKEAPDSPADPTKDQEYKEAVAKANKEIEAAKASAATVRNDVEKLKKELQAQAQSQNGTYISLVKDYGTLYGSAIKFIAYDKTDMVQKLDLDRTETEVHSFNSSNLTKTTVDLTIPGIGGILLFEAFAVDRLPNMLDRGYYIVTKVAHEFTLNAGWITKLQGRFRYKPPGTPALTGPRNAPDVVPEGEVAWPIRL